MSARADGFIVCHWMMWLHGVSASGLHQDDRDDHQHPPGAWFPQSREYTVLSCVRLANSPGRLCLRPPPNTPLRTLRFCCSKMIMTTGCKKSVQGRAAAPSRPHRNVSREYACGLDENALRRGGPPCPPVLTDLLVGIGWCGCATCPLSAFTKTTGMIINIHRALGSRNRGNTLFCLVSVWLTPPVVYASGLHRTRRSARYVSAVRK